MSQLVMDVSQKQDALMPKKKFAFSSRKKASTQVPSQTPPTAPAAPGGTEGGTTVAMRPESCVGFRQRDKEILEMIVGRYLPTLHSCSTPSCYLPRMERSKVTTSTSPIYLVVRFVSMVVPVLST